MTAFGSTICADFVRYKKSVFDVNTPHKEKAADPLISAASIMMVYNSNLFIVRCKITVAGD